MAIFLFLVFNVLLPASTSNASPMIAIVKSMDNPQYSDSIKGFLEVINKEIPSNRVKIYDLNEKNIIENINSKKPSLILTIGTTATLLITDKIKSTPIVFSMIMAPQESGITDKKIAGASLDIPIKMQLEKLKDSLPGLNRIGVMYNPAENENIIKEARQKAKDLGLILKSCPVKSVEEVLGIKEFNFDVLWIIPDSVVCQPGIIKELLLKSLNQKVPVIGLTQSYVKAGALMAMQCDYKDNGRQAGEISVRILKGSNYSDLNICVPRRTKLYLNVAIADRLKIKIPASLISQAEEVFGK
ncbi:MAG: ABC transporter substrate-binding protein [Candidatus Omnitrophota bacterium]